MQDTGWLSCTPCKSLRCNYQYLAKLCNECPLPLQWHMLYCCKFEGSIKTTVWKVDLEKQCHAKVSMQKMYSLLHSKMEMPYNFLYKSICSINTYNLLLPPNPQ